MKDEVYVILIEGSFIMLFPRFQDKENFKEGSTCFKCSAETTIDEIREFVYSTGCDFLHGHFRSIMKPVW